MIKFNNSDIIDWNFDDSNIIKVYHNGAIVFYKFDTEQGGYKVCYAVVDDITQYQETEFEDVFDKATEKWYKLNNLNQYEEYGVYGSGRTSCEGSSRLPQGYTEVKYVENTSTAYIDTRAYLNTSNFEVGYTFWGNRAQWGYVHQNVGNGAWVTAVNDYAYMGRYDSSYRVAISSYLTSDENTIVYTQSGVTVNGTSISKNLNLSGTDNLNASTLLFFAWYDFYRTGVEHLFNSKVKSFYLKNNGTLVRDFVPAKRDSDNKYGMYDIVNDVFYLSPNNVDFSGGSPVTPTDCVTTYNGKLTIDGTQEYEWNGSSWVNLGEVSGSTATLPDVPFTLNYNAKQYIASTYTIPQTEGQLQNVDAVCNYGYKILDHSADRYISVTGNSRMILSGNNGTYLNRSNTQANCPMTIISKAKTTSGYSIFTDRNSSSRQYMYRQDKTYAYLCGTGNTSLDSCICSDSIPSILSVRVYYDSGIKAKWNNWTTSASSTPEEYAYNNQSLTNGGALFCDYSNSNSEFWQGDFYWIYMSQTELTDEQVQQVIDYNEENSQTIYPKYYSEKSEPLDNLTFNTLAEAQAYAEANCVYDGMHATIDGDRYYFDSSDENGWVKILEYYKFEDVTPGGASGWTISGSSTYNPDLSYYDDFDLQTTSTSYSYKIAKVTIYGYDHFTYYLRTTGRTSYCYVVATNVDEVSTPPSSLSYNSSSAITNTYYWNKSPKSAVNLSNYRRVTYNNLDKTVEHTFYVYFYGRTYSSYVGNATILIPKEQTNENWEQVTFSASSNVASAQKNLYIDNNNTTSGGTQYFYYRWMVGLPSGSHTSYTNYSNYNYCPDVTSSTFTSVAGEQRQANFTYDNTTNKILSFRLTDGSNVLTPSDTVYYNMTYYNSCGVSSSSSNVTFPRSQSVKAGGRFRFANSSNRHYIYGYSPNISLNTNYYVDNYQSTFDITYTKLSEEAVTVTYTTYDPNDSETPLFKTDITWPYSGGTTSSTTLTSYAVPYTYSYKVSQTSDKFSAASQTYTAGQSSRTISFTLYPNNREFATVADMNAYQYAWEGMKAKVGDTNYKYENGEWVEKQYSLPDVPFTVNYNAKQYNASTKTLLKTEGQLADVDAVITAGTPTVNNGYLTIASSTRATISGYQNYFNRTNSTPNLTIISKQKTNGNDCHMFANRDGSYNWMYRVYSTQLAFHGSSNVGGTNVTTQPVIESVRVDSSRTLKFNNYTDNTTTSVSNFSYGSTNSGNFALFAGYASSTGEWFVGDFYWVYMCQGTLTDEQVQQVIDYNENL